MIVDFHIETTGSEVNGCPETINSPNIQFTMAMHIGMDGRSAYQVWLDAGHEGTEEEFIQSLQVGIAPNVQIKFKGNTMQYFIPGDPTGFKIGIVRSKHITSKYKEYQKKHFKNYLITDDTHSQYTYGTIQTGSVWWTNIRVVPWEAEGRIWRNVPYTAEQLIKRYLYDEQLEGIEAVMQLSPIEAMMRLHRTSNQTKRIAIFHDPKSNIGCRIDFTMPLKLVAFKEILNENGVIIQRIMGAPVEFRVRVRTPFVEGGSRQAIYEFCQSKAFGQKSYIEALQP